VYHPASSTSSPTPDLQTVSTDSRTEESYSPVDPPTISTPLATSSSATSHHAFSYQSSSQSVVNMHHLELLHHMSTVTCKEVGSDGNKSRQAFEVGMSFALNAPFLMHEILAISALHLSTLRPNQKDFYCNQATELQTSALSLFTNLSDSYNTANPVPIFLFSSFLGIHVLFDTLLFRPSNFSVFIERFVEYLRLHRGVSTIAKGTYTLMRETELEVLISRGEGGEIKGNECDELMSLVSSADLSQASIDVCRKAVEHLQWVFDSSNVRNNPTSSEDMGDAGVIFAWPITISQEFIELLRQKRPEALAILGNYAVLLHWRRDLWIFGDGGRFLIESIAKYLGSYWEHWLAFPMSVLRAVDATN
jgi:hypothetical protein